MKTAAKLFVDDDFFLGLKQKKKNSENRVKFIWMFKRLSIKEIMG